MSFKEFTQQKYGLNNVGEPENIDELVKQEQKGRRI